MVAKSSDKCPSKREVGENLIQKRRGNVAIETKIRVRQLEIKECQQASEATAGNECFLP